VESLLADRPLKKVVYERDGLLVPDEEAIEQMQACLTTKTDLILGVGSGVIQDLCKYVSFQNSLPYMIVATAPSMDGYASKGAAMILNRMKVTVTAHVPNAILADVNILAQAPMDMIRSGYGDILGKFSCLNDWKLGNVVNDEYFCQHVYDMTEEMLMRTKDLGQLLQKRDLQAVQTLMEALIGIGIAMAYVGNSRPGSGSEHHLSHFFEITGIVHDEPYLVHGTDVAYSAVYTQRLRERLLRLSTPEALSRHNSVQWEEKIGHVYGSAAAGVIELQNRLGWYQTDRVPRYLQRWARIRDVLSEPPSSAEMERYLQSVGFDLKTFDDLYGREKIANAIAYGKDLKDRYSVLWLYYDLFGATIDF